MHYDLQSAFLQDWNIPMFIKKLTLKLIIFPAGASPPKGRQLFLRLKKSLCKTIEICLSKNCRNQESIYKAFVTSPNSYFLEYESHLEESYPYYLFRFL